ncbi:MAG: class E sortase [Actinobacteria bacterium]|nr:class E sortase [Actinomycetota bacterium]
MREPRRFLLVLVLGLLLFAGGLVAVIKTTEPTQALADTPLLAADPIPVSTSTSTTTTVVEATTSSAPPPRVAASRAPAPVRPPREPYAQEPIVEIGRIEIPKIGLNHKIMHGITMRNIDHGPSHWPGTAFPGEVGNSVFAGHRVTHSKPFRNIDQLVPGDEVFFVVNGIRSRYVVTGSEVVMPTRLDIVTPTPTPTATIFACHPPGSAKQRYVVRMSLAPLEEPAASGS